MATDKLPKKQKLRNAEYYDFQRVQDELYSRSLKNHQFKNLMDSICMEENIRLAYRNLKKNAGSKTPGVDNKTIKDLATWSDERLIEHVRKRLSWYTPQAVRRVEIPKDNGQTRPIGISTIMERLIQQCILQVLEPICEAKFHERSNGFRPNRSTGNALAQSYKYMQVNGLDFVIDIDIKSFFDTVSHGKLLKQLWTLGIRDKKLLSILSAMLKAEVAGIGFPEQGTPQGSVISPLLSNVVLNELDWWITSQWEEIHTHTDKAYVRKDNGKVDKGKLYDKLRRTNLKECYIVRYADDFKIFCRKWSDAIKVFEATKLWLKDRLGLEISPEKSKIINLKYKYSNFVGFRMRLHRKGKESNGEPKYTVESHVSQKAVDRIKIRSQLFIKKIYHSGGNMPGYTAVNRYNSYVIGIHNYYAMATHVSVDFHPIAFLVKKSLKRRFKSGLKREGKHISEFIRERYGKSSELRYIYNTAVIPIGFIQHQNPLFKRKSINQYTAEGRAEIHKNLQNTNMDVLRYLMRNPVIGRSVEYNDNRISLYSGQMGKCAVTGQELEIGEMHCHHKTPVSQGGKDNYQNLVFVTDSVHILINATKPDTIAGYMMFLKLSKRQLGKLNTLRKLVGNEEIKQK